MTTARTPLRLPLAGGLTDIREYAGEFGGLTVSSTIDLGVEVRLAANPSGAFELLSEGRRDSAPRASELKNELAREAILSVDPAYPPVRIEVGLEVVGNSGLGASGAITVAMLHALRVARGERPTAAALAEEAAAIEVDRLGGASGYHDSHVCARGGLLRLEYAGPQVSAAAVNLQPEFAGTFQRSLLLFETGRQASTKISLKKLADGFGQALPVLHEMKALAAELAVALERGELHAVARCIGHQQRLKERLPGDFNDSLIGSVRSRVERLGAAVQFPGGKVGGYLYVCCPDDQQDAVRAALNDLREVPFKFSLGGSAVVA